MKLTIGKFTFHIIKQTKNLRFDKLEYFFSLYL
jgi:hypothetical protein